MLHSRRPLHQLWHPTLRALASPHTLRALSLTPQPPLTDPLKNRQNTRSFQGTKQSQTNALPVVLNFADSEAAYASKSTLEVYRAFIVLKLCTFNFLVDNNDSLMKMTRKVFGKTLFQLLMRMTFYGQFVGGEDVGDLKPKLDHMQQYGVRPILDYSVEADLSEDASDAVPEHIDDKDSSQYQRDNISAHRDLHNPVARTYPYSGEESCEANLKIFLNCLETASAVCKGDAFSAIKVTGLSKPNALLEASQLLFKIRALYEEFSVPLDDRIPEFLKVDHLPIGFHGDQPLLTQRRMSKEAFTIMLRHYGSDLPDEEIAAVFRQMDTDSKGHIPFYHFRTFCLPYNPLYNLLSKIGALPSLTKEHVIAMDNLEKRLVIISERAVELDARLLIDAEQTYFQPVIDYYANKMMYRFNKKKAFIFNTYQCYLTDTTNQLISDIEKSRKQNYKVGVKLVRGAYMEQERTRAMELDYEDPIHTDKAATNACYHNNIEILMQLLGRKEADVMIASHNEFSIQYVVERMRQVGVDPKTGGVFFGQLLGMCDQVTYLLGAGGYSSYKYVPYGPVEAVLPYLSRRAHENKGVLQGNKKELDLLLCELKRRRFGLVPGATKS